MFSLSPQSSHVALKTSLGRRWESPDLGREMEKLFPVSAAGSTYGRQEGSESQKTCEDVYTFMRLPALKHPGLEVESGRGIGKSRLRRERSDGRCRAVRGPVMGRNARRVIQSMKP